jgi:hypothetical protein
MCLGGTNTTVHATGEALIEIPPRYLVFSLSFRSDISMSSLQRSSFLVSIKERPKWRNRLSSTQLSAYHLHARMLDTTHLNVSHVRTRVPNPAHLNILVLVLEHFSYSLQEFVLSRREPYHHNTLSLHARIPNTTHLDRHVLHNPLISSILAANFNTSGSCTARSSSGPVTRSE